MSRIHIAFALGKAREDRRDYDAAFAAYASGNALKHQTVRYTTEQMQAELSMRRNALHGRTCSKTRAARAARPRIRSLSWACRAPGSTLIEQILASHPEVDGTLELPNILSLAHRLRGRSQITDRDRYPASSMR
jgi:hypothetical protein